VLTYSNILILATSVVLAGNLSLKRSHVVCSPAAHGFQVAFLKITTSPTAASSRMFLSEQEPDSRVERSNGSRSIVQSSAVSIVDPPFLRHPVFFDPNSLEPSLVGRNMLQRAAIWLREHRETRVLIVGSCDSSGSETCTHVPPLDANDLTIKRVCRVRVFDRPKTADVHEAMRLEVGAGAFHISRSH
jgi:hypothetical protein